MFSRPWTTALGASLALAMIPLLGSSVRPQMIDDDSGSLAAAVEPGGFAMPPAAEPKERKAADGKAKGRILLDEDFDGNTLDASIWNTCHWWQEDGCTIGSNEELEWYLPEQATVSDGVLQLTAEPRAISASDGKDYSFASGMVTTGPPAHEKAPKLAFTYGKVEARIRIPTGQGLWPAIWLLPANEESRPEIDILEVLGHDAGRLRMRLHPKDREADSVGKKYVLPDGYTLAGGWHTIGVDWSPGKLVYFLDGRQVWQLVDEQVPDEPMYLVMNLAVGGSFPGAPDADTKFPAVFGIDHVRIRSND